MDFGSSRVYEIELWSAAGTRLADISDKAMNRHIELDRNGDELLRFDLDVTVFEAFCTSIGISDPVELLHPYRTDIKVKRNGTYWKGFQVVAMPFDLSANGSEAGSSTASREIVTVIATGYLNLFTDRYVTKDYTGIDACVIAEDLITTTQAATNGNAGVTIQVGNYRTTKLRDRSYVRQNVKQGIVNLTNLIDGHFDFDFSYDKKFRTYSQIGSLRTDIKFSYGGPSGNVTAFSMERTATGLYNDVIGLGSGFGPDQLVSEQQDTTSQLNSGLRQSIQQFNSVELQDTLDQNTQAFVDKSKNVLEIPKITITGNELINIPFLSVGDRIPLVVSNHPLLKSINGTYLIERMVIDIDDNDFERSIQLYFDNYAVSG